MEKVATQRLVESRPLTIFDDDSNHLTMLLSTVLKHDDFEYDTDTDKVEPRSASDFLKKIEDNCGDIPDKDAKLASIRNKVLDKMKRTLKRERRLSTSGSVCSNMSFSSSRTRPRSESENNDDQISAKHSKMSSLKTVPPPIPVSTSPPKQ